jgi:hypothetical protein
MTMAMRFWKTKGTNNKSVHTYIHRTNKHGKEHFGEKKWDIYMHIAFAD